jgi:hypothetical protein
MNTEHEMTVNEMIDQRRAQPAFFLSAWGERTPLFSQTNMADIVGALKMELQRQPSESDEQLARRIATTAASDVFGDGYTVDDDDVDRYLRLLHAGTALQQYRDSQTPLPIPTTAQAVVLRD